MNVEIVFSAFKRIFSNSVNADKMKNIVHEIKLKIIVYTGYFTWHRMRS